MAAFLGAAFEGGEPLPFDPRRVIGDGIPAGYSQIPQYHLEYIYDMYETDALDNEFAPPKPAYAALADQLRGGHALVCFADTGPATVTMRIERQPYDPDNEPDETEDTQHDWITWYDVFGNKYDAGTMNTFPVFARTDAVKAADAQARTDKVGYQFIAKRYVQHHPFGFPRQLLLTVPPSARRPIPLHFYVTSDDDDGVVRPVGEINWGTATLDALIDAGCTFSIPNSEFAPLAMPAPSLQVVAKRTMIAHQDVLPLPAPGTDARTLFDKIPLYARFSNNNTNISNGVVGWHVSHHV